MVFTSRAVAATEDNGVMSLVFSLVFGGFSDLPCVRCTFKRTDSCDTCSIFDECFHHLRSFFFTLTPFSLLENKMIILNNLNSHCLFQCF